VPARFTLCILVVAACGRSPSGWQVRDHFLRAPDGRAVILRGANVADAHKRAPYLDGKQLDDYRRLRDDWGMNAIRLVMTWAAVEPNEGQYDDAYLDRVRARLDWAAAAGLAVVLDMHQDIYGEGFGFDGAPRWTCDAARYAAFTPSTPWFLSALDPNVTACVDGFYARPELQKHFVAAWRRVAERLHTHPAVIGFDVLNEPLWGTYSIFDYEHDRLQPLYGRVVAEVRAAAPGWVAFLEPGASRNQGIATSLETFDFANVMYAPHSYDAAAEGGSGFDPANRRRIIDNAAKLANEARTLDAGLWFGEYGGMTSTPGIAEYMTAQYDAAGAVAAGTMYWSYDANDGYGLLAADGTPKPALLEVLVRPYPERVAGDPVSYGFDAATATFTFVYRPDRALALPTELRVPSRVYPTGYQVECGDCRHHTSGDALVIDVPPSEELATISVHP
jgi:endoglycosylceramidase